LPLEIFFFGKLFLLGIFNLLLVSGLLRFLLSSLSFFLFTFLAVLLSHVLCGLLNGHTGDLISLGLLSC
jgi:hypothetical protein